MNIFRFIICLVCSAGVLNISRLCQQYYHKGSDWFYFFIVGLVIVWLWLAGVFYEKRIL